MSKRSAEDKGDHPDTKKQKLDESTASAAAAAANPPPPAANVLPAPHLMLHQHALVSIFKFLSLDELHHAFTVSKEWNKAVGSQAMELINGCWTYRGHPLTMNPAAHLLRHVGTVLRAQLPVYGDILELFANITVLDLTTPDPWELWDDEEHQHLAIAKFPEKLKILRLHEMLPGERTNRFLQLAAQRHSLKDFRLTLEGSITMIDFKLLYPAQNLTHFIVEIADDQIANYPTNQQVTDLRQLPFQQVLPCDVEGGQHQHLALRLLKPPHELKWRSLGSRLVRIDTLHWPVEWHEAVFHLPSLTELNIEFGDGLYTASHVPNPMRCLEPLVNLESLTLSDNTMERLNPLALFNVLQVRAKLTSLHLHNCDLTSNQMGDLFQYLPDLCQLKLTNCRNINSLNFFGEHTRILQTLTHFTIKDCPIANEPFHLHKLKRLRELVVHMPNPRRFCTPVWCVLCPPTSILPRLIELELAIGSPSIFIDFRAAPPAIGQ